MNSQIFFSHIKQRIIPYAGMIFIFTFVFLFFFWSKEDLSKYSLEEKHIEGDSMEPLIKNGSKIILIRDYFQDNTPKVGDIVAYDYQGKTHPLIKVIRATDADSIEIDASLKNIKINGNLLKNSGGDFYVFTPNELRMIALYIQNEHIPRGSYLIFGDNVTNSVDSRKFGAVSKSNFGGKFIFEQYRKE